MKTLITLTFLLSFLIVPHFCGFTGDANSFEIANIPMNKGILPPNENKPYTLEKKLVAEFIGEVSFYNLGDINQNDDSPCIGAFNENLCDALDNGELLVANNYYDKGTLLCFEGIGCGRVADRMNSRYEKSNFDIAMKLEDKQLALSLGRQMVLTRIYKK